MLAEVAKRLRVANVDSEKARKVLEAVGAATARSLHNTLAVSAELAGGELRASTDAEMPTFQQIGEKWTSGELAKRHPDQIRAKRSADADVSRLVSHVYDHIGNRPVHTLCLDDFEHVMAALPEKLAPATRRNVG